MGDGGKGSLQRPTNKKKFDEGYDRIFNNKQKEKEDVSKFSKSSSNTK